MITILLISMLKTTKLSKIITLIAIGANNNEVIGDDGSLKPNLFKFKNIQKILKD